MNPAPVASVVVAAPDTAAGHQLAWVMRSIAASPEEADAASHFTAEFLARFPATKIVAMLREVGASAPFTLATVQPGKVSPERLVAVAHAANGRDHVIRLAISPESGRMKMLSIHPKVAVPATAAGEQLAWVLSATSTPPSEPEAASHFTPAFLAVAPAAQIVAIFSGLMPDGPFMLEAAPSGSQSELAAVARSLAGPRLTVRLSVDATSGRMASLLLQPIQPKLDVKPGAT